MDRFTLVDSICERFTPQIASIVGKATVRKSDVDHDLPGYLNDARKAVGSPSLRMIAAGTDYSHTTVAKTFSPTAGAVAWPIIEQVSAAVNADTAHVHRLWIEASTRHAINGQLPATEQAGLADGESPSAQRLSLLVYSALLVCGGVILVVMQAVDKDIARTTAITDAVQILFIVGAAAQILGRAVKSNRDADRRNLRFFILLVTGIGGWALGAMVWFVERHVLHHDIPGGYYQDLGFLLMPVCVGAALWLRANQYGWVWLASAWHAGVVVLVFVTCPYTLMVLLLTVLQLRTSGDVLLYAVYPATDIALGLMALGPLVCGHRIFASGLLCMGFLANAASDVGYLLIRADPSKTAFPPAAALGYVVFAAVMVYYALLGRPLPADARRPVPVRVAWVRPRTVIAASIAIGAVVAIIAAAVGIWLTPGSDAKTVMFAVTVSVACGLALVDIRRQPSPRRGPETAKPSSS